MAANTLAYGFVDLRHMFSERLSTVGTRVVFNAVGELAKGHAHLPQEAQQIIQIQEIGLLPALHVLDAAAPARLRPRPLAPEAHDEGGHGGVLSRWAHIWLRF